MKKWIALTMSLVLIFLCAQTVSASQFEEETVDVIPYVSLGADLKEEQRKTVLQIMGLTKDDLSNCKVLTVSNEEEHKYLDAYLSKDVIGSRALSSVMVTAEEKGAGLDITTENINYCTVSMYKNALITAGMQDATVVVVGPFEISGTAALIGAVKAYAQMNNVEIDETALETATNELVLTGKLGASMGDEEKAANLIAYAKQRVIEGNLESDKEIQQAVKQAAKEFKIDLTEEESAQITQLLKKVSALDLDPNALKNQAEDLFNKLKDMGLDIDTRNISSIFNKIIDAILGFFRDLFS